MYFEARELAGVSVGYAPVYNLFTSEVRDEVVTRDELHKAIVDAVKNYLESLNLSTYQHAIVRLKSFATVEITNLRPPLFNCQHVDTASDCMWTIYHDCKDRGLKALKLNPKE